MDTTELTMTLPGPDGANDAWRAVTVIEKLLTMLSDLEGGGRGSKSQWAFHELKLGSVVTTLAPSRPRPGSSVAKMSEVLERAIDGFASAEQTDGIPAAWNVPAAKTCVDLIRLLPSDFPGLQLDLCRNGHSVRKITVSRAAADHLSAGLSYRTDSIGSVIGQLGSVTVHRRRMASLWPEHSGAGMIPVLFREKDDDIIRNALGRRVEVQGGLERDVEGHVTKVRMRHLEVLQEASPPITDLIGIAPDLTGGMDAANYLDWIRDAAD